ncbi:MAG: hypothetical protein RL518_412 [Pseudomonadota bacterium]
MPKKLQIKLLSQSAELLSVTNCSAGHISVLRAEAPSELRPYQRALSGNQGRERFIITVDGAEYKTEEHNLIGFGEIAPHSGLTVSQYLASFGLIEGAISGLLMSFGIEGIEHKACAALSPDEERKVRLFAATADPTKALVINEPFEPIMSSWRERVAEFLSDFARSKNGLVIITSLSYRPDTWIDNPIISRHQVGQSLRRTIGFGSADSQSSQLMNQLRDQIRAEQNDPATSSSHRDQRPQAAAISLGAAALTGAGATDLSDEERFIEPETGGLVSKLASLSSLKTGAALIAGGLGIFAALTLLGVLPGQHSGEPSSQVASNLERQHHDHAQHAASNTETSPQHKEAGAAARHNPPPADTKPSYVLDHYPEAIRVSLLDTARGTLGEASAPQAPAPQASSSNESGGNFYKLLESTSTDKSNSDNREPADQADNEGGWSEDESSDSTAELDVTEEEERREAIRQKFLEAIRAAAETQQESAEE